MVCEVVSGYICNMEIYSAEGKKLEDTVLSLLDRNSVRLAKTLPDRYMRVCSTVGANRGIQHDLEGESKHLKKGQSLFQRKGDIRFKCSRYKDLCKW
jgi:hypothetical protein